MGQKFSLCRSQLVSNVLTCYLHWSRLLLYYLLFYSWDSLRVVVGGFTAKITFHQPLLGKVKLVEVRLGCNNLFFTKPG